MVRAESRHREPGPDGAHGSQKRVQRRVAAHETNLLRPHAVERREEIGIRCDINGGIAIQFITRPLILWDGTAYPARHRAISSRRRITWASIKVSALLRPQRPRSENSKLPPTRQRLNHEAETVVTCALLTSAPLPPGLSLALAGPKKTPVTSQPSFTLYIAPQNHAFLSSLHLV